MDTRKLSAGCCSVARALALVGDAWSVLIVREAGRGRTQFDQFVSTLGIAPKTLSARLKALTDRGVLERRQYSDRPRRFDYVLTQAGRDFLPVLTAMSKWGTQYNGEGLDSRED